MAYSNLTIKLLVSDNTNITDLAAIKDWLRSRDHVRSVRFKFPLSEEDRADDACDCPPGGCTCDEVKTADKSSRVIKTKKRAAYAGQP